jgi:hypothetical protein
MQFGAFLLSLSERGARLLELAELAGAWPLEQSSSASLFYRIERGHEMARGRSICFGAVIAILMLYPQSCRRKRILMMRQGPLPLAAMTLL